MRTCNVLSITCAAALVTGTASFTGGFAGTTTPATATSTTTPPLAFQTSCKKRRAGSSLHMSSIPGSNLFSLGDNRRYDEELLQSRHSASDWLHNVFTLPRSSVLRDILNPVVTIALWGALVSILQRIMAGSSSKVVSKFASDICIGSAPHSFLVSSLGLLLVFRTNSAYQRFNEGRVIWENILSVSRNISRMTMLYNKEVGKDRQRRIRNLVAAFPYLLRHHLRLGCLCESQDKDSIPAQDRLLLHDKRQAIVDTRFEGDKNWKTRESSRKCYVNKQHFPWSLFEKKSLQKVARAQNRPLWVCDRVGREIMSIPYGPNFTSRERLALLGSVEKLTNTVGQCERIHQTSVPLNYARHSLRALTLWLVTLPFCLVKDMGFLTGPAMAIISWLLFGVYQIGYSIEDPFQGTLRLSILCDAIRKDVLSETLGRDSAFDLDWDDDEDDDDWEDSEDVSLKELKRVEEVVKPYIPPVNTSDLILNAPSFIKENGNWNVVGAREG